MPRKILSPDTVHKPTTYYSHAVVVDDVVYLAGQAPHDLSGDVWDTSDPIGQVRHAFENMGRVLEAAGASFADVVRMSILLRRDDVLNAVWVLSQDYLGDHRPAMTVAVVDGLAHKDYLLEFDAIAVKGE